ncbi:ECF RNA polymerase sigma factor SigE [Planctomycetes bacterium Poly30]|uniref:RNA polymerase sigma factor n=1 Tax=Saltatorellus ferox TaxID=2528018 RepID=A0A518EV13_9BACT|nr:ECF RNA polymerase sigma factor SigE [Planctomycetes bacterium Poly30]
MSPPPGEEPGEKPDPRNESSDSENGPAEPEYDPAPMQAEATQLMTAARMGSSDAFETLFRKVRGSAFQAARSLVGSHEDAQDLTQEAFIKAYKARDSYDPTQPFLPWFHRILRNTCFSFLRKKGRLRERSIHRTDASGEDATWDIVDENAPNPSERAEHDERTHAFSAALDKLKARDREIIVLRHYQDLSYKDIAAALSIPEGTVMSRLFHARKRLQALLSEDVAQVVASGTRPRERKRGATSKPTREGLVS